MAHRYIVTEAMVSEGHLVEARDEVTGALRYQIYQPCEFQDAWPLSLTTVPIPGPVEPNPADIAAVELAATDAGMARVMEDVIAALVARNVIRTADLPAAAQAKLAARAALRQRMGGH